MEYPSGWTPDSREVVFISNRAEKWGVYRQPFSGGPVQPLLVEKTTQFGFGFPRPTPDGGWLLVERPSPGSAPGTRNDLLRVPLTGGREERIAEDILEDARCANPPIELCAYIRLQKNQFIFTGFDSQLKQRRELGRFTLDPNFKGGNQWTLSPDATEIAILEAGTGNIYLLNVKTRALQHIVVKRWSNLVGIDWTADGKGFFMCGLRHGGVLLHVDLHGNAQVLWEPGGAGFWAIPSPDGKHVAMSLFSNNANVWMMENF
jgi:Tol biopolymer transport system component